MERLRAIPQQFQITHDEIQIHHTAYPVGPPPGLEGQVASCSKAKRTKVDSVALHNGVLIPAIGYGCAFGNWTDSSRWQGIKTIKK